MTVKTGVIWTLDLTLLPLFLYLEREPVTRTLLMLLNFRPNPRSWNLACEGNNETLKTKEKPKKAMKMPKIKS